MLIFLLLLLRPRLLAVARPMTAADDWALIYFSISGGRVAGNGSGLGARWVDDGGLKGCMSEGGLTFGARMSGVRFEGEGST